MKELFVIIDMQNDFLTGTLANPDGVAVIPNIVDVATTVKANGGTIVFTRDTHTDGYLDTREGRLLPIPHCISGTEGHQIVSELQPFTQNAIVFDKPSFGSLELAEYAKKNAFDKITLVGVCTDICVISNAFTLKTYLPESEIVVLKDCCAGVTPDGHENALKAMQAAQITIL